MRSSARQGASKRRTSDRLLVEQGSPHVVAPGNVDHHYAGYLARIECRFFSRAAGPLLVRFPDGDGPGLRVRVALFDGPARLAGAACGIPAGRVLAVSPGLAGA